MKAWVQTGFGGAAVRQWLDVPVPVPAADEVLVRVAACALNRLDLLQRAAAVVQPFVLPHIAGMDITGTVTACGGPAGAGLQGATVVIDPVVVCGHCDRCAAGLPMYCRTLRTIGSTRPGGFAEYVAVPARNCLVLADGDAVGPVEMAAVPVAGVTAQHGLFTAGRLQPGETVVIPGAGSGLGCAAIPMAVAAGCRVIALVGSDTRLAPARALGAAVVIDRTTQDWGAAVLAATGGQGADLVWDHVGGAFTQQAIEASRIGGRIVLSGSTAGPRSTITGPSLFHWGRSLIGHGGYTPAELRLVVDRARHGARPVIDSVWEFADLPRAEAKLESGDFFGKILVRVHA